MATLWSMRRGLAMLSMNIIFIGLSNVLQKKLFVTGMGVLAYQCLSSLSTCIIAYFMLPKRIIPSWSLFWIVILMIIQYIFYNLALDFDDPGVLKISFSCEVLLLGTISGKFFFQEGILMAPYFACLTLIGVGMFMIADSAAISLWGGIFIFCGSLFYVWYNGYQRIHVVNSLTANFFFRIGVIMFSTPVYIYQGMVLPTGYQLILLAILGMANLIYGVCFLEASGCVNVHIAMMFPSFGTPVSYTFQYLILGVVPTFSEIVGATLIFLACLSYPSALFYHESRHKIVRLHADPETPLLQSATFLLGGTPS